jgi:uncharacterized metal-binding protein YceD (DUF177 family)
MLLGLEQLDQKLNGTINIDKKQIDSVYADISVHYDAFICSKNELLVLNLSFNANLKIKCQRCMESYDYELSPTLELAIIQDQDAEQLMLDYDCIDLVDGKIDLERIISDEIILSIPHAHQELSMCNQQFDGDDKQTIEGTKNPFSKLKELLEA